MSFVWVEPAVSCFVVQRTTNRHFFFSPYLLWFEPATSSTEAQHTTDCASQTAVVMWGIIFVYMLKLIDVFPLKKKRPPYAVYDLETTAYKVKPTTNCASQTAVMMWGIVCVYMLKLIDMFFFKKKKEEEDRPVYDLETTACEVKCTFDCASKVVVMMQEKYSSIHDLSWLMSSPLTKKTRAWDFLQWKSSTPSTVLARLRWWCKKNIRVI